MKIKSIIILIYCSCCFLLLKSQEIGICINYSNGEIMKLNGYSYIEAGVGNFLIPNKEDAEFKRMLLNANANPLPIKACNGFIPKELKSVGPNAVHLEILKYMEQAFKRAYETGIDIIVYGSGGSRSVPEGFSHQEAQDQLVELFKKMTPIAEKYKVIVVIEPLNSKECNFINTVKEGAEIVNKVNHPNLQLLVDIYHMMMDDESPDNIVEYGDYIKHVHVAEKEGRAAPGTHNEDLSPYYRALKTINYKGKISIECSWTDFEHQLPIAIKTIKEQLNL